MLQMAVKMTMLLNTRCGYVIVGGGDYQNFGNGS